LGSDRPFELLDVIHRIERKVAKDAQIDWQPEAPGDVRATWASIEKARELLGWEPETDLDAGLEACVAWYERERAWARQVETAD
jgi:nucleoside-diphosphate-sugar epimerase